MSEARRQQYAKALGVALWYSRVQLPGAPPTPRYDFTGIDEVGQWPMAEKGRQLDRAPERKAAVVARAAGSIPSAAALLRPAQEAPGVRASAPMAASETKAPAPERDKTPAPERDKPPAPGADKPSASMTDESAQAYVAGAARPMVPVFHLQGSRVAGRLLLNLAHPDTDAGRESLLLDNLASALWGVESPVERLFEFGWPVFASSALHGQDEATARRVLAMTIEPYIADTRGLVLFGCPSFWSDLPPGSQVPLSRLLAGLVVGAEIPVLATFSLGEQLFEPQRKKDVWHHLRSFPAAH